MIAKKNIYILLWPTFDGMVCDVVCVDRQEMA